MSRWRHVLHPTDAERIEAHLLRIERLMYDMQHTINRRTDSIMADLAALQTAATQISTDVGEAITALNDLAAKIAAGDPVVQADVDAITATLTSASSALDEAVATDDPPVTPTA